MKLIYVCSSEDEKYEVLHNPTIWHEPIWEISRPNVVQKNWNSFLELLEFKRLCSLPFLNTLLMMVILNLVEILSHTKKLHIMFSFVYPFKLFEN